MDKNEDVEWNVQRALKGIPTSLDDSAALIAYAILRLADAMEKNTEAVRDLVNDTKEIGGGSNRPGAPRARPAPVR